MEWKLKHTEQSFIDINIYALSKNTTQKKLFDILKILTLVLGILIVIVTLMSSITGNWVMVVVPLILGVLMLLLPKFYRKLVNYSLKKMYKTAVMENQQTDSVLQLTDDEVKATWKGTQMISKLAELKMFVETRDYFIIDANVAMVLGVEKKQLDDVNGFRDAFIHKMEQYNIPCVVRMDWDNQLYSKNNIIKI